MNSSCPDYSGVADMICEEIRAKDVALSEAQARIEELEAILRQVGEATGRIGDDGVCPVCNTYTHKAWCWYSVLYMWSKEQDSK